MPRYSGDPREMFAKFNSRCCKCHRGIRKGDPIIWWPVANQVFHIECGEADFKRFLLAAEDERQLNMMMGQS